MKVNNALKKIEKAGGTITTRFDPRNDTTTYYAKFEGKTRHIEFWVNKGEDEFDTFAIPYAYNEADQNTLCFFRDTVKGAIECATR